MVRPWLGRTIARAQVFNGIEGSAAEGGMLFGLSPKMNRRELFGRDAELEIIKAQATAGNWVVVAGQRMMGKTSLVKVALSELGRVSSPSMLT